MQFKISSLKECDSSELKELMLACQPFVKVRDDADYWIFQRFFSSTSFIVRSNGKLVGALTSWGDPENSTDIYTERSMNFHLFYALPHVQDIQRNASEAIYKYSSQEY